MPETDLIAETNRLLRTILDHDAAQRARAEEMSGKMEKELAEVRAKTDERLTARLREQGLSEAALEGGEEDWEKRREEASRRSKERMEEATAREARYKEELLDELRTQSKLLQRIAERLEA